MTITDWLKGVSLQATSKRPSLKQFREQWAAGQTKEPEPCSGTDFLCFVEGIQVLQRSAEQLCWRLSENPGQTFACLQIRVGSGALFLLTGPYFGGILCFLLEPFDLRQRLRGEAAERGSAWERENGRHLRIAKGGRHFRVSLEDAGERGWVNTVQLIH